MNKLTYRHGFGLLVSAFFILLSGCSSTDVDANKKKNVSSQSTVISAPESLQGTALAFDINKTELISGTDPRLARDGTLKNYFYADRMFSDGRDYNG
ncbi:MAG: hypothetical protein ABW044_00175, partial [Cellvibrio sp.]